MKAKRVLTRCSTIAVLGSGEIGRALLSCFSGNERLSGKKYFLVDSDPKKRGLLVDGHRVYSLDDLDSISPGLVILAFNGSNAVYESASRALRKYYTGSILSALEVFADYPEVRGWPINKPAYYRSRKKDFEWIQSLLSDRESKRQYRSYYAWASRQAGAKPPEGTGDNQYFDDKVVALKSDEVFVDCGAFRGDTLSSFLRISGGRFGEYYAFEPDRNNYAALVRMTEGLEPACRRRVHCHNMAVLDISRYVSFQSEAAQYSHVSDSDSNWVQGVAIDDFKFHAAPTFIKLDLEGQDYKALFGAIHTLHQYSPVLCVAIYHNAADFFDIPLLLSGALKGYRFYMRAHNRFAFDFVMYCIPPGRSVL